MGKTSKPSFSGGTIKVNGQTKAQTYRKKNNVISNYNMSEAEKRAYDYAQNSFADALPSVNVFDENTQKNLQSQLAAYALDGQKMVIHQCLITLNQTLHHVLATLTILYLWTI